MYSLKLVCSLAKQNRNIMKTRIPMIMKKKGFKQVSFNTGIYEGGLYVIISGGMGQLYKTLKK